MTRWTTVVPVVAAVLLVATWGSKPAAVVLVLVGIVLAGAVLAAVHHAEVVAHRVGEPYGSIVLAVAVTVIEVGLIVTLMVSGDSDDAATLARDTVFAAVMITCNGIVGIAHRGRAAPALAEFNPEGSATALATVCTLATLSSSCRTSRRARPARSSSAQLTFAAIASMALYTLFVFIQAIRHRDYFLPVEEDPSHESHADPPTGRAATSSLILLVVALVAVVGLAKIESPAIEDAVDAVGAPQSAVGVIIALLVLAPETLAAVRNARRDRMQTSINLALRLGDREHRAHDPGDRRGAIWVEGPLVLGLEPTQMVLLAIRPSSARSPCSRGARRCRKAACTSRSSPPSCSSPSCPESYAASWAGRARPRRAPAWARARGGA